MKKIIAFFVIIWITSPLAAQENQQHFLWFSGHWSKTKKNTFITTSYKDSLGGKAIQIGGGSTIALAPDGKVTISSPGIDDWNKKIDDGENELEKTINQMKDPSNEMSEWSYHFNEATVPLLDSLKTQWASYKIGKKEDILNQTQKNKTPAPSMKSVAEQFCKKVEPKYQAIIDFYNAHLHDKSYDNPPPPQFDFTCYACDTNLVKKQANEDSIYESNFFKPENKLIEDGLSIEHDLELMGLNQDVYEGNTPSYKLYETLFHKDKNNPSKSGPCSYLDNQELNKAIVFLTMRQYYKAEKLLMDNRDNFQAAKAETETFLTAARSCMLSGFSVDSHLAELGGLVKKTLDYYFNKLVKDHDWSQLANIPFIIELAREYRLMGGQLDDEQFVSQIYKVLNGFQLKIEMDIKVGKDNGYMIAHLKGKTKITPEFKYGSDSCYEWVVAEDAPNSLGEPIKKGDQRIDVDVLDNEMILPKKPTYTGTKKYWCVLGKLKMDYCHPGMDSILLTGFNPDPVMNGTWIYPTISEPVRSGINGLDHFFVDLALMQQLAESGALLKQTEAIQAQTLKLENQIKDMQANMRNSQGSSRSEDYQKMNDMITQLRQLTANQTMGPVMYMYFPLQIQNNNTVLFNKRFDAKDINPGLADVVVYGYYTVDIEYTGGN